MNTAHHSFTRYYGSYEAREAAFSRSISGLIPRKYAGPRRFWKEFGRISRESLVHTAEHLTAYITSNPRDCLAFGSACQVISAAVMTASANNAGTDGPSVEKIADQFGLSNTLDQPIRTLSGGEMVKLALAKIWCIADISTKLSIASPFSWLSAGNRHLMDGVLAHYHDLSIPTEILSLTGEDDPRPVSPTYHRWVREKTVKCRVHTRDIEVPLGTLISTLTSGPSVARIRDVDMHIDSPCLLTGENGQGKSLVAKALCNAIGKTGRLWIETDKVKGYGRLLFQDVITQTLLRTVKSIANTPGCPDPGLAMSLFETIRDISTRVHGEISRNDTPQAPDNNVKKHSLLEMKIILAAVRLCNRPPALIMDEPDWGLTRNRAMAFVLAVIKTAHDLGVPVFLISHKPWWQPIARTILKVNKETDPSYRFVISLQQESEQMP